MVTVDDFGLSEIELELLETVQIANVPSLVNYLELYKIVSRERIVEVLFKDNPDICVITNYSSNENFKEIENRYNVLIDYCSGRNVVIIYDIMSSEFDKTSLSIALSQYDITFCAVTHCNYLELIKQDVRSMYREDILFKRIVLEAINLKATDLHFSVAHVDDEVFYPIYYRSAGKLHKMNLFDLTSEISTNMITKFIEQKTYGLSYREQDFDSPQPDSFLL